MYVIMGEKDAFFNKRVFGQGGYFVLQYAYRVTIIISLLRNFYGISNRKKNSFILTRKASLTCTGL